jgi:hypothetical protein
VGLVVVGEMPSVKGWIRTIQYKKHVPSPRTCAAIYNDAYRGMVERLGGHVPSCAKPLLREYGRIVVELERNSPELQRAMTRRHLTEARRLRREARVLRFMLLKLQAQLERLAGIQQEHTDPLESLFVTSEDA